MKLKIVLVTCRFVIGKLVTGGLVIHKSFIHFSINQINNFLNIKSLKQNRIIFKATLTVLFSIFTLIAFSQNKKTNQPTKWLNFVSCPIIRDSKTLPCWLVEYEGELYYLGQQGRTSSAFYPPQLNHQVLVEGVLSDAPRICGGIPLSNVRVSVMQEINRNCNTLLPAEEGYEPPKPIPPASRAAMPDSMREFTIPFDFDSDFLTLHTTLIVSEAVRIAHLHKNTKIEVTGYRATTLLSNGIQMKEKENMAEVRAEKIKDILIGLGLTKDNIKVHFSEKSEPFDGLNDANKRRVTIKII